ncbi:ELAV-like protein 2 [Saccostrea cucullata]|uniref:ELAV-like protein 2 n=1 Tax=Saccostrea cuccullata TaxID=36930 RepID=UPI002ED4AD5C
MSDPSTNLIVNYLPQTLSDEGFKEMFEKIGPLKSYKIVRDKATNYSYGFGFVDYLNAEDAERAIHEMNGQKMDHKTIKVSHARKNDSECKGANIYIANIPRSFGEEDLTQHFMQYGEIIQVRLLREKSTNESKGVGFVYYTKRSEAAAALEAMNGQTLLKGYPSLSIKFADINARKGRAPYQIQVHQPNLRYPTPGSNPYSGGPHGPMRSSNTRMRFNPMSGGYSNAMAGGDMGGHILFVYNIGYDAEEKTLWQLFAPLGTVTKVNVIMDHIRNQCKGYGFVTMKNLHEAEGAILALNGALYNNRRLSVSFKS